MTDFSSASDLHRDSSTTVQEQQTLENSATGNSSSDEIEPGVVQEREASSSWSTSTSILSETNRCVFNQKCVFYVFGVSKLIIYKYILYKLYIYIFTNY